MSNYLEILHTVSSKLPNIETEAQVYQILNDAIMQILPNSYFVITKLQPDDMNFRIIHSFGVDKFVPFVKTILGKDLYQIDFPFADLTEEKRIQFESRKLYHAPGGIHEAVNGNINKTVCNTIEKFLGISEVYGLSFCVDKAFFGGALLFIRKTTMELGVFNKECILTIESLAAQASFAINRFRDYDTLSKSKIQLDTAKQELEFQYEERKKRAEELREANERFSNFVSHSPDIIYKYSTKRGDLFWSDRTEEILGYTPQAIIDNPELLCNSIPQEDKDRIINVIKNDEIKEKSSIEYRFRTKQGKYIWLHDYLMHKTEIDNEIIIEGHATDITAKKEAELALIESEIRWKFAIEGNSDGLWDWDLLTDNVYYSEQWTKMLGFCSHEISCSLEEWNTRVHQDDRTRVYDAIEKHLNGTTDYYKSEHRVLCKDDTYKWILDRGKIISYTEDGRPKRMIGTHSDISLRKKTEKELKNSVSLLTATLESTVDGILVVDKSGKNLTYNTKFLKLWNIPDSVIKTHSDNQLISFVLDQLLDPEHFLTKVNEMYLSDKAFFDVVNFKDGRIFERYSQPQMLDGKCVGRVWSFRDVTERIKGEIAIRDSEEKFRNVFEQSPIGLYRTSPKGEILFANPALVTMLSYDSLEELKKKNIKESELVDNLTRETFIKEIDEKGVVVDFESIWIKKDGSTIMVSENARAIYDDQKNILFYDGVAVDITERKLAEKALKESDERWKTLLQDNPNLAVQGYDKNGKTIYWNKTSEMLYGYTSEEAVGRNIIDLIIPKEAQISVKNAMKEMFDTTIPIPASELKLKRKNGSLIDVFSSHSYFQIPGRDPEMYCLDIDMTERKRVEAELVNAKEKYRIITQASLDIIFILDRTGKIIFSNDTMEAILGYQAHEFIGKSFTHFVPKKELPRYFKALIDVFKNKEIRDFYTQIYHKDGRLLDVEINGKMIRHEGKLAGQGTIRDITQRKQLENSLLENQLRYEKSQALGHVGNWEYDIETELLWVSDETKRIYGADLESNNFTIVNVENCIVDRERVHQALMDLINHEKKYDIEFEIRPKDNTPTKVIHSIAALERDESNTPVKVRGVILDITDRKKTEKELKESKERYSEAQTIAQLGHWEFDLKNNKHSWSDEVYNIFDVDPANVSATYENFIENIHPDDRDFVNNTYTASVKEKKEYEIEHRLLLQSGVIKYVQEKGYTQYSADGEPIRSLGTILDITELKKIEQLLKESNATKDKFFSIIAHDLRSPFNGILGFSELLMESPEDIDPEEAQEYIGLINSSAKETLTLLDNLLKWAETQSGKINFKPEKQDSSAVIKRIIDQSTTRAKSKNIVLKQINPKEIAVFADQNMFKTVLRNLISNAIKFTNTGGEITVSASKKGKFLEVVISDNGVGMSEETKNGLFRLETNETTIGTSGENGSGLGLVLCKEFADKQGGKIWVESEVGKGSNFKFTLPLAK